MSKMKDRIIHLRNKAKSGLQYAGRDEDGEDLWMGSDREWKKFEELNK